MLKKKLKQKRLPKKAASFFKYYLGLGPRVT